MPELKKLLADGRRYIWAALFIFVVGAFLGYVYHGPFGEAIAPFMENLRELAKRIEAVNSPLYMSWLIFQNNLVASLTLLILGTVLFVIPIFSLFINGVAVGYVLAITSLQEGVSPFSMFLFGILPHGLLELPAVFLAGGIGMFFGLRLLYWLFGSGQFLAHLFGGMEQSVGEFWQEKSLPALGQRARGAVRLVLVVAVMLLGAAVIESFITPVLLFLFVY